MQQPEFEQIPSGAFSAAAIAQCDPDLYADITDLFLLLDPRDLTKAVLEDRQAAKVFVIEALDHMFGEVADPYADEDDS